VDAHPAQFTANRRAIHLGQEDIEHDQVKLDGCGPIECFASREGGIDR
jgi:hypothetical protein